MADVKVTRFEPYPIEEPTGWAIGFTATCSNGRSFYIDTVVSYTEAATDEEALTCATNSLRDQIVTRITDLEKKPPLLNTSITL